MSLLATVGTETLRATLAAALDFGTVNYNWGLWFKPSAQELGEIATLGNQVNPTGLWQELYSDTGPYRLRNIYDTGADIGGYQWSTATWYWITMTRTSNADFCRLRVFGDSTSTTPLFENTSGAADNDNYTTLDTLLVGTRGSGLNTALGEYQLLKIQANAGTEWTNAQCRAESRRFGIQKAGGTNRLCYGLETLADASFGLTDSGGVGAALVNSGFTNGSTRPLVLEPRPRPFVTQFQGVT